MPITFTSGDDIPNTDSPGPPKGGLRGGGPPGGGPGGPPGGGFTGFSGIRPQVFRGLQGVGDNIPLLLRKRGIDLNAMPGVPVRGGAAPAFMAPGQPISQAPQQPMGYAGGGFVPGVTGGPVQPSDTVPAALTPGEMVMNRGVMSNPTISAVLTLLNILGADRQDDGGMGMEQEGEDCPHCGGKMKPGEEPDEQGYACGGHVKGYAFGGFAGGRSMFGGGRLGMGMFGGGAKPGGATPTGGSSGGAQPAGGPSGGEGGGWTSGGQYSIASPGKGGGSYWQDQGGTVRNRGGDVISYDPRNPWGSYTGSLNPGAVGQANRTIGGYGQAGYFDPRGNQMLINSMNEAAQGTADSLVRRQMSEADLGGMDPAQRAVAKLQALRETGRGVQDIMANTRAQALGDANDFAQQLFGQSYGAGLNWNAADQNQQLSDYNANQANERNKKGQWGQLGGQILGSAVGGYASGWGQSRGSGKKKED